MRAWNVYFTDKLLILRQPENALQLFSAHLRPCQSACCHMLNNLKIPFVIFISSWTALAYEVLLTRIFSISLWYHFAFMIISIAMLGFAASGVLLALYPGIKDLSRLPTYSLWLAIAITGSYLLANM